MSYILVVAQDLLGTHAHTLKELSRRFLCPFCDTLADNEYHQSFPDDSDERRCGLKQPRLCQEPRTHPPLQAVLLPV